MAIKVSIVIPVYNEENSIIQVLKHLEQIMAQSNIIYELVVVNDGSSDNTKEKLAGVPVKIKLIEHEQNRGYGAALKTGIANSEHELIVITDADETYPHERIPELINNIEHYDMVVGARTGANVNIPTLRKFPKWVLNSLANYLCSEKIPDLNSGLRVIKKSIVNKFIYILPNGFSFTTTITLAMLTNDYRVKYLPIDYYARTGESKIKPFKDTLNFLQLIIRTIMYFNPLDSVVTRL
jgi:glycosyltransferase involved in cell wall biosynthesis